MVSQIKDPKVKTLKLKNWNCYLWYMSKALKILKKLEKIRKKINIIEVKSKNSKKVLSLLLKSTQLILLVMAKILKNKTKIEYIS